MAKRGISNRLWWLGGIVLIIILLANFSNLIVKWLWLNGLGYEQVFWTIKGTQFLLFGGALIVALLYIGTNVYFLTQQLSPIHLNIGQTPTGEANVQQFNPKQIKTILYTAGGVLSLFFAFSYFFQWNEFFRFFWSQPFGTTDPIFGNDIGFYIFQLPFLQTIQNSLSFIVFIVTAFIIVFYIASGSLSFQKGQWGPTLNMNKRTRKQVFSNVGIWLLLLAWGYYLERFQLLFSDGDLIFGAGYTEAHVVIPVLWVLTIGLLALAVLSFLQIYRQKISWVIKGAIGLFVVGVIGQIFLPAAIQNFMVQPNELNLEKPYLKNNIKYTRLAYNLDDIKVKSYKAKDTLSFSDIQQNKAVIKNIRVWDQELIVNTYRQLQEIRLYYQFFNVDLDRYHTSKGYRQVLISARELKTTLPEKAQTWVNKHLQYTHGYGVVMSPTTQKTEQGSPIFYIKDLPPESSINIEVTKPAIYYGESGSDYKLVNTEIGELHYPKGDKNVYTHYQGKGGVSINSFWEQLLFAWEFGDMNLLLTDYIREGSKIQFWHTIQTRVKQIAPFLELSDDPYMVISNGKLYWIQDAYTTASRFPYAAPYNGRFNYIRNSVKVVVDAYNGSVNFYISNPNDPVLQVYRTIFPNMFKPLSAMPGDLKHHIKYPKHLFSVQLEIFSTYHMTTPQVFYNQEDLWERPMESYGSQYIQMKPYYLLSSLPGKHKLQYLLISPMTPSNRDNMIAWMTAKSDFPNYGEIVVYQLPKERLFLGPAQIEAKINQNTKISRRLSLWDQRGSKVIRGNLMVIPIKHSFIYVEPVFLISQGVNIPQLKRVIVSTGSRVVMEPTLNQALAALYGKKQFKIPLLTMPDQPTAIPMPSPTSTQMKKLQNLWDDLKTALENSNWETFGQKMEALNELIEE